MMAQAQVCKKDVPETRVNWSKVRSSTDAEQALKGAEVFGSKFSLAALTQDKRDFRPDWEALHAKWKGTTKDSLRSEPTISSYCEFYRQIGLNPKDTPPSVLNIIQRFLSKEQLEKFPVINPVVDAVNVAAVATLIPLGVFDAACVKGELLLDTAREGDSYVPLGMQQAVDIKPGVLVLRDSEKVLSQFCYRDSDVQKVTPQTNEIWLLACKVPGVSTEAVTSALDNARYTLQRDYNIGALNP